MALVHGIVQGSAEWHALRREGVGASEVAALIGVHKATYQKSKWCLFMEKSGRAEFPEDSNDRMIHGLIKEPAILKIHALQAGWTLLGPAYAIDDEEPQMRASLDNIIAEPTAEVLRYLPKATGPGVVDSKSVAADQVGWEKDWQRNPSDSKRPTPPPRHHVQVQQQMGCTGYNWGVLAPEIAGSSYPRYYWMRSDKHIARLRQAIAEFYRDIVFGLEPPIDGGDVASAAIRREYAEEPHKARLRLHRDTELDHICEMRSSAYARRKDDDEQCSLWDNRLRRTLGSYESAEGNFWIATGKIGSDGKRRYYVYRKRADG